MTHGLVNWREVLDPKVVEGLIELAGADEPGLFGELVELYCEDTPPRIAALIAGRAAGDWSAVESAAHAMKSSSANLGATDLSELCRLIETRAREGDHAGAAEAVGRVPGEYRRVVDALRQV